MEEVYGAEVFAKTWKAWVDGIAQYAKRPEGTETMMMQIQDISKRKTMQEKYILHQDPRYYFAQGKHGEHIEDASLFLFCCNESRVKIVTLLSSCQGVSAWNFCP